MWALLKRRWRINKQEGTRRGQTGLMEKARRRFRNTRGRVQPAVASNDASNAAPTTKLSVTLLRTQRLKTSTRNYAARKHKCMLYTWSIARYTHFPGRMVISAFIVKPYAPRYSKDSAIPCYRECLLLRNKHYIVTCLLNVGNVLWRKE